MNILFLLGLYPSYGGTERVTTVLANAFVGKGYNVHIASFEQPNPEIAERELQKSVTLHKLQQPYLSDENIAHLHDIIVEHNIDFIINQWATLYKIPLLCRRAIKDTECKLITVHHNNPGTNARIQAVEMDIAANKGNRFVNAIKMACVQLVTRLSLRMTYSLSDRYLVLSPSFIPIAQKFFFLKNTPKIGSIFNPITRDVNTPFNTNKNKEIIYVGRIEYNQKRVFRLLEIWKELQDKHQDWTLTFVGDGPQRDDVERIIKEQDLKRISIEGFKDPVEYYRRASILVLTSEYEGFPLVIGEAMAYGVVPVILGSFAAAYDIYENGKAGLILDTPYKAQDFINSLDKLMPDKEALCGMENHAIAAAQKFSLSQILTDWDRIFKETRSKG